MSTATMNISTDDSSITSSSCCDGGFNFPGILPSSVVDNSINQWNKRKRKFHDHHNNASSTNNNNREYEALLNEGMKHLTFDEIQQEQELLHGVADENDLHENTVNDLLSSLQKHLDRTKTDTAYETAEQRNQSYARNRELQMAFLRANRFDPKESAEKIITFFKYKQDLFDDKCLVRDITTQDLDKDDLKCLLEGYFQYSPFRDRSGRKIFMEFPGVRTKTSIRTELRARFYMWANAIETMVDISKGTVSVSYLVSQYQDHLNSSGYVESFALFNTVPLNVAGTHACTDNSLERIITNTLCAMMPYHDRVKTRVHFGSHTECQYLLASYGITRGALPLTGPHSDMDLSHHHAWYQERILQEQQEQQQELQNISAPVASAASKQNNGSDGPRNRNENDVLSLGRIVKGVGNDRFQSLGKRYFAAYENGSSSSRLKIVNQIINEIHSHGGRFLKLDNNASSAKTDSSISLEKDDDQNVWIELSPDERCAKVTQLFRNFRRKRSRLLNPSTITLGSSSSTGAQQSSGASPPCPIFVDSTNPEDVLFGQYVVNNPGNLRLRDLVLGVKKEYDGSERGKKKEIVLRLIETIHESGGRFLMVRKDQRWEVVPDEIAREKISKQFRNLRRKR